MGACLQQLLQTIIEITILYLLTTVLYFLYTACHIAGKFGGILIWCFANSQGLADFNLVKA